jgi:gamma-glutamylcyclotransferase (GGCT)/AIG2-like uncharacterized protein YtfP
VERLPDRFVFVYGTLRRGGGNDITRRHPDARYVAGAEIAATLYDLGAYPGAVLHDTRCSVGTGIVKGEIYRIDHLIESALDRLEEVAEDGSGEYLKRSIDVRAGSAVFSCLVYEINVSRLDGRAVIASGDWLSRD